MKKISFEDYLASKHADSYTGLDDEMVDDFEEWLTDLDIDNFIRYGQLYAKKAWDTGMENISKEIEKILDIKF